MTTMSPVYDEAYSMTDPSSRLNLTALAKPVNHTLSFLKFGVLAVSVAAAIPTAKNLYVSWKTGVPFERVNHSIAQYELWTRNVDCKPDYQKLSTVGGIRVDVGACPKTGDIAFQIKGPDGKATNEWIAFDQLTKPASPSASLFNLIVTPAVAETISKPQPQPQPRPADGSFRVAQTGMVVMCQAKVDDKIVRIIKDGGKCFRETISPFTGSTDKREEVPCDTQC